MKPRNLLCALAIVAVSAFFATGPAAAQTMQTWISGEGDDTLNPCSRTAPCLTFLRALSATPTGGQINCLDAGDFGPVVIDKSVTIDCTGTLGAIQNTPDVYTKPIEAISINDAGTATPRTARVVLRGLTINGSNPIGGLSGIRFQSGASLIVEDVVIQNQPFNIGAGIYVAPAAGTAEVFIRGARIFRIGAPALLVRPTGAGSVNVFVEDTSLTDSDSGLRVDVTATTGFASVSLADSVVTGNRNGIAVVADAGNPGQVTVTRSIISGSVNGVSAASPGVVRIGDSMLTSNVTAMSGNVLSYGNNQMAGNGSNGASSPIAPLGGP